MPRSTTTSYGTGGVSTWKVGILVLYHAGAGRFHAKTPRSAKTAKKTYRFRCDYVAYATATCFLTKARSRAMAAMSAGSYSRCRESGPAKCAEASSRNTSGQGQPDVVMQLAVPDLENAERARPGPGGSLITDRRHTRFPQKRTLRPQSAPDRCAARPAGQSTGRHRSPSGTESGTDRKRTRLNS